MVIPWQVIDPELICVQVTLDELNRSYLYIVLSAALCALGKLIKSILYMCMYIYIHMHIYICIYMITKEKDYDSERMKEAGSWQGLEGGYGKGK